jgi:DMSO reductase anchor subunit
VSLTSDAATFDHRALAAGLAGSALGASLLHLGRPAHAWKALRNLRRSWLSREVLLLGVYAAVAAVAAVVAAPALVLAAAAVGVAGVGASGRLYVVPGRPSWNTPLTIAAFYLAGLATGPLLTGHRGLAAGAAAAQLALWLANLVRLARDPRREWNGTVVLHRDRFPTLTALRVAATVGGIALATTAAPAAFVLVLLGLGELVGRYLFYVTVVPLNMPGSFARTTRRSHA